MTSVRTIGTPSDITGQQLGSWVAVRWIGEMSPWTQTRIWELNCECGRVRTMSLSDFRAYQKAGRVPRCTCQTASGQRRVARDEQSRPRLRRPAKINCACCAQPWRVPLGKTCSCGLTYEPEARVELELDSRSSSASLALDAAPGSFG